MASIGINNGKYGSCRVEPRKLTDRSASKEPGEVKKQRNRAKRKAAKSARRKS